MDDENSTSTTDQWFDSTFNILNESYQLDSRRLMSPDTCELIHAISDFYMYDSIALFTHLLALTSHYLASTSFIYADNQLKHKLNLHLLLIVRAGFERSSIVDHFKQAMNNVQCIRQTGQQFDSRHSLPMINPNIFCRSDDLAVPSGFCISDKFDEHMTNSHLQRQYNFSIIGISNGPYVRRILDIKFNNNHSHTSTNTDWLMLFLASKARLFCRRTKLFDSNRYPSLEQWIMVINCHCTQTIDFHFDEPQTNQLICDYLDALALKATSLEDNHPWMAARCLAAREHVLRISASLRTIEMAIETLIIYRRTFHTFGQADKLFFDRCIHIIEQTKTTTTTKTIIQRVNIGVAIVQAAIYFVNTSVKQFEIMFEPTLTNHTNNPELPSILTQSPSVVDRSWIIHPSSSSSSSLPSRTTTNSPVSSSAPKRMKTFVDPSYVKSLELAHELLLLPHVAFTRTSLYVNSKLKRNAAYLDSVIEELKKHHLLITIRQGVQMVDGTRRRVDLLVKCAPNLRINDDQDEEKNDDLIERLGRFGVDYDRYVQTLGTLDIGEKYRLSDQCFDLLNSPTYKRHLTIDLERLAPLHRVQQQQQQQQQEPEQTPREEMAEFWTSPPIKAEPTELYS